MIKNLLLATLIILFLFGCKKNNKPKIEKFIWIQNNANWISEPCDLKAKYYIEYFSDSKTINFAHSVFNRIENRLYIEHTDYYKSEAPQELEETIYKFLLNKKYLQMYRNPHKSLGIFLDDSDHYCIIYQFENESEQIITYRLHNLTDSLKFFAEQLISYKELKSFETQKPFNIDFYTRKYEKVILCGIPLAPKFVQDSSEQVKVVYRILRNNNK